MCARGLDVTGHDDAAGSITVTGTVSAINNAFGVTLQRYENAQTGQYYRGRVGAVHVPESLHNVIVGVFGLDMRPVGRGYNRRAEATTQPLIGINQAGAAPALPPNTYFPLTVGSLYGFPDDADGAGQTIGILTFNGMSEPGGNLSPGGYDAAMVNAYFTRILRMSPPTISDVVVQGPGNTPGDGRDELDSSGEVCLDLGREYPAHRPAQPVNGASTFRRDERPSTPAPPCASRARTAQRHCTIDQRRHSASALIIGTQS